MMARRTSYFSKQIEDFFFAGFGVQIDELVLLAGGGDEVFQDFSLRGIGGRVLHPMKIQTDLADGGAHVDIAAEFRQTIDIFSGAPRMDAEGWQNQLRALTDLLQLQVGWQVHRRGDGKDLLFVDLLQSAIE